MTNRTLLATVTTLLSLSVSAQITLDECKTSARDNYPAVKQYRLIELSRDYTVDNASKAWLPKVSVAAGAVAMTDLTEKMATGAATDISNEIYGAMLQVNQTIYDGGTTAARKRVTRAEADVEKGRLDVTMYDINSRVEEIFFGILTIDEKLKQIRLLQNDLELSMRTVNGMINGGLANLSDKDAIKVEQLKASQQESSLTTSRDAYVRMLAAFTGKDMPSSTQFEKPSDTITPSYGTITNRRPELEYYSARLRLLDEQRHTLDTKLRPQISFFGAAVYHNRINDLLKNGTLAAGVTLSWNIGALYTRKNDIRDIETQKLQTESQRETFLLNTRMQNENSYGNINGLKKQIALDDEIITLRENIRQTTEKKVENGTETVNELLRHINSVSEARQAKAMHEIALIRELYSLRHTNNI
ncbi:TolC family protein [Prevotella sp. HCN-7019]|uniref:TolC family protein n=1 Tax=Prevotella sp. HCN-7019 TaxID=3134668 RepID=UPI0030C2A2D4